MSPFPPPFRRPMLHVAISEGYDLVGIRWDTTSGNNVVIFEKDLR